ncbi:disintegrin and metalloproteinase domain-containing protein 23-like isoform X1 [Scyliorhinus canicula]|uniref:disintegrin and metalloproteinase domain-containing protein 23-like isoform X1 n=1 Tax=Scyliorhinus canicula TaxID=7830 RepID=UPI0018F72702|nr:disintegrin and metalloproteinase domain-containing protein 23-like isoform X1 [Scyliorhinus canicula]
MNLPGRCCFLSLLLLCSSLQPFGATVLQLSGADGEPLAAGATATLNHSSDTPQQEIAWPLRLIYYVHDDNESTYHVLDTKARDQQKHQQAVHLTHASFQIDAFGSTFILDVTLNHNLLSSKYKEIHYEKQKTFFSKGGEHCYYHGQIRGIARSKVALSTCDGLHGMFDDGNYTYIIEPLEQTHTEENSPRPHIVHRIPVGLAEKNIDSGNRSRADMTWSFLADVPWLRTRRRRRAAHRNSVFYEMKYLELMIVNDHKMYKRHQSSRPRTNNFAKSVVNLLDFIFKEQLNTRVVLVAVETWSDKDKIDVGHDQMQTLRSFAKYRQPLVSEQADSVQLLSGTTFKSSMSSMAFFGGVCSLTRGVGVNECGEVWSTTAVLGQSLAQNLGVQWKSESKRKKECECPGSWAGCFMEDTGFYHPRKFSKCSIMEYKEFLQRGGGACLFNRPTKLFETTECGNGYVESGEECDCGLRVECFGSCCKKCSLANGAHCSDGPCCNHTCQFIKRGYDCRDAVNDCDIAEYCTGDSGQCAPNLHKQDGYSCDLSQGRCFSGECKTRDNQCKLIWGSKASSSDKFCYEKLNTEGTEKGNCGKDGNKWLQCSKHDVFCGYLLCTGVSRVPRIGRLLGEITPTSFYHQGKLVDCSGSHIIMNDGTDLGYVEDGTPCGPSMMCMDRRCQPINSFNISNCSSGSMTKICSGHGLCSNEATCICEGTWAGTDCSMYDPKRREAKPPPEGPKGPSATNLIIGSIAGAILVAAIVLGGTGWGFKNVKKRRYDPSQAGAI